MNHTVAECINILGNFCGKRDVKTLSQACLLHQYGIAQADVMVLFGGSIISGGDILAEAIKNRAAKKYVIVGGAGHTTETLRSKIHDALPVIPTENLSEAEIFDSYINAVYGLHADYLETRSTNCGNNITYLLDLLRSQNIPFTSIILCQDGAMQHRMEAGLRKYTDDRVKIINYAAYQAEVVCVEGKLTYRTDIRGMWDIDRYVSLLMGEIPRLSDDVNGYGPNGKDFIAHVDIPVQVLNAFEELKRYFGNSVREANPLFASK